ncbi:iron-sulfur cluster co-chaperone protein HscB isoform X2 [Petromyzon marinus]|uniref:Iron-sulfur cluster co-chaperone protein HscB isoform X2 n=2 Tax=Petromyzon marinus TaxID=7757 RepID=A0AAJ7TVM4_PETMA|nr:iron-sulfur cluster co-chaperone protein HscB isoform X2 [Petromyzon marinus]
MARGALRARTSTCPPPPHPSSVIFASCISTSTASPSARPRLCPSPVRRLCGASQVGEPGEEAAPRCWGCRSDVGADSVFFCSRCHSVLPPRPGASLFQLLGCNESFSVNLQKLQQAYLALQRQLHPDNFSQKSQRELDLSQQQSALVNKAYNTLLKPLPRGVYLLERHGLSLEDTTEDMDPEFLMEIMEINEDLEDADSLQEIEDISRCNLEKLQELTQEVMQAFDAGNFLLARLLLTKMNYFTNIDEKVKEKRLQYS